MLVAASAVTTRHDLLRKRWQLEGGLPPVRGSQLDPGRRTAAGANVGSIKTPSDITLTWRKSDYRVCDTADDLTPSITGETPYRGTFVVYDMDAGEIVWTEDWGQTVLTPTGFVFADDVIFVADSEAAAVFVIDLGHRFGSIIRRISHPSFNDCHGIARSSRGVLVSCTGTDAVIEVDLDGNLLWDWWAADHGYTISPSGHSRAADRAKDHRYWHYHTRYQTTHVNTVAFADENERFVLATLFHQGELIRIDRENPDATPEVLLDGLARPHSIRKVPGGWLLANSWGCEMLMLDENFAIADRFRYSGGWMQDCLRLSDGRFLLNDVDNHRVVHVDGPPFCETLSLPYDDLWRVYSIEEVPQRHCETFLAQRALRIA